MNKWNKILEYLKNSKSEIKILKTARETPVREMEQYGIEPDSALESIVSHCGGLVFDNFIRLYGCGELDIFVRNAELNIDGAFVIGEDILGGLFAYLDERTIWYFAPDTLEWEDLEITYTQFIRWLCIGEVSTFYGDDRWQGWENDIRNIALHEGVLVFPFLWTPAKERTRKIVPMNEILRLEMEYNRQPVK